MKPFMTNSGSLSTARLSQNCGTFVPNHTVLTVGLDVSFLLSLDPPCSQPALPRVTLSPSACLR